MEDSKVSIQLLSGDEESKVSCNSCVSVSLDEVRAENGPGLGIKAASVSASASNRHAVSTLNQEEETATESHRMFVPNPSSREADKERGSSLQLKNSAGKRKVKMDWTQELHKKFVLAVEQLGLGKAVPSKILELMGTDCLTRHNVASHLQKYRSHQKHLLAREVEAARWSRKRNGGSGKRYENTWVVPTVGYPPVTPMPHLRPFHVWGHPSVDQSFLQCWPKSQASSPCPSPWATGYPSPAPLPGDPYWCYPNYDVPVPGMPYFPPPFTPSRFPTLNNPEIHPTGTYGVNHVVGVPSIPAKQTLPEPPLDFYLQSKENVDEIIGDVLSKPWLPLPIGLKPPLIDSVMVELQRKGISKIPPSCE